MNVVLVGIYRKEKYKSKIKELYDLMFNKIEFSKFAHDESGNLKFREEILRNELTDMKYSEGSLSCNYSTLLF